MRRLFYAAIVTAALLQAAHAQDNAAHVVTYVEVMPTAVAAGKIVLARYREASRREDGNLRFDVLQEIARPNRFAIVEAWRNKAALDAHALAASTTQFDDALKPIQDAPDDERVTSELYLAQGNSRPGAGAIYVVTHVDVIPAGKDETMAALKAMRADTAYDPGNISYEVLQQIDRSNHFTVVETWTDRKSLDGHAMAAHTRVFREKLMPIAGALYDERFYQALK